MISLEQVVLKMAEEIEKAKQTGDEGQVREHVRAIRLLADLVLDQESKVEAQQSEPAISDQELRKMMGSKVEPKSKPKSSDNYGQSDSDSLLDF